ncbi:MAG: hypothetical protein IKY27_01930 [Bacteroidales bacterium]|nr:hypothetical protein [Bacteroidales bacterium]
MKKKTRNGKALTLLLGLFLSSLMFSCETINKSKTEDVFSRETKIFYWYADSLNINIPNEKHTFFLVPDYSCSGCVVKTIDVLFPETDSSTLITTPRIAQRYIKEITDGIIIDTNGLVCNLNWDYYNIIEIQTKNNKVIFAKSYSSEEFVGM